MDNFCQFHAQEKTLICLTDGCNTLLCQECTTTHRPIHSNGIDQKIMNFADVLQFCINSQNLFCDSLQSQLSQIAQQDHHSEMQNRMKSLKNLKQSLREQIREYFNKLSSEYQHILMQQQETYLAGVKRLKDQIEEKLAFAKSMLHAMEQKSQSTQSALQGLGVFTKKQLYESQAYSRQAKSSSAVSGTAAQSAIKTIKEQELMKSQLQTFQTEYKQLAADFRQDKLFVDSEIEQNLQYFLSKAISLDPQILIIQTHPEPSSEASQNTQQIQQKQIYQVQLEPSQTIPQQLKEQFDCKPLTLNDLDVNTHDYFMKKPFLHFFNIDHNQIVLHYIGKQDDNQPAKKNEQAPNRARFQSTYLADSKNFNLIHNKGQHTSSDIIRNLFKGNIEKKQMTKLISLQRALNSTFAIPKNHRSIALPNREIYVVGGQYDGNTVSFVFNYSWETNALVEASKPLLLSRSNFAIAQLNNYIYVVGGYNEKLGAIKSCEVMDVVTKQWSSIADMNVECKDLSLCSFNNRMLYKFGGVGSDDQLNEYIEKYEPQTNKWISYHIPNKSTLRTKFQLYALSGCVQINPTHIMVFGGSDAGLSEDTDQTFLCQIGQDHCRIVGLNKVTISTKGAIITNPVIHNNEIYSMQLQRDKKGNFHPYKRTMMLYSDKAWKVNN